MLSLFPLYAKHIQSCLILKMTHMWSGIGKWGLYSKSRFWENSAGSQNAVQMHIESISPFPYCWISASNWKTNVIPIVKVKPGWLTMKISGIHCFHNVINLWLDNACLFMPCKNSPVDWNEKLQLPVCVKVCELWNRNKNPLHSC